jgi:hypothetical protein
MPMLVEEAKNSCTMGMLLCLDRRQRLIFTLGAILVLTLGIGLNVTFFQIYNLSALKPLNVRNPETLVELHRFRNGTPAGGRLPYPAMEYIRENSTALSSVLVSARQRYILWEDDETRLPAHFVSANWFGELGGGTTAGRLFIESVDGKPDAAPVVILSYPFWANKVATRFSCVVFARTANQLSSLFMTIEDMIGTKLRPGSHSRFFRVGKTN